MKKQLPLLLAALLLSFAMRAQTAPPIAHWTMSGNVADSSGNSHNGTMFNLTPATGQNGVPNSAMFFSGANSYITIPYSPAWNMPKFSLCAILEPTAFYSGTCQTSEIIARGTMFSYGSWGIQLYEGAYPGNDCSTYDSTQEIFAGGISTNMDPIKDTLWKYSPSVTTNTWYRVVLTYDDTTARVYINGILKSTVRFNIRIGSSTEGIAIGMSRTGDTANYPYPFIGAIDDITIYDRVLSETEISAYGNTATSVSGTPSLAEDVQVYPNPAAEVLNVRLERKVRQASVAIYSSIGQLMVSRPMKSNMEQIPVTGWPAGQYLMQLQADGMSAAKRFVIE